MAKYLTVNYGDEIFVRERYVRIAYYHIENDCDEILEVTSLGVRSAPFVTSNGRLIEGIGVDQAFGAAVEAWYKDLDVDTLDQSAVDALKVSWALSFGILVKHMTVFGSDPIFAT